MSRAYEECELGGSDVRKIVWKGPFVEIGKDAGLSVQPGEYSMYREVSGAVGITGSGHYKAAQVGRLEVRNWKGEAELRVEDWSWNEKRYSIKEHAIFAAREWVAQSVENGRRLRADPAAEHAAPDRSVAAKYGGISEPPERQLPPPSRSR
jgi:hypothetical protein